MRTSSPRPVIKPIALAVALALAAPHAFAAPVGHTVVAGDIQVTQPNAQTMVITQGSEKAIVNWRGFSIAAGETVQFVQPTSSSVALNRVTSSAAPSEIFGRLSANGKVFLVNPSGVMFGKGASVDVGGLVASTLDIADDDFLGGRYAFADSSGRAGAVRNEGRLAASERGTIALLGGQVSNEGTVTARLGTVGLAAGGKVTLDFNGDGLTRIVVDAARINALVENGGAIISDGGQVTMTARAVSAIADTVVRQQGVVQATALVERNGRIVLDGGTEGKVELTGTIDATGRGTGQRGGEVALLGRDIHLGASAAIDASGDTGGGSVLVGGDYRGANPLAPHAASTTMAAGAAIRANALGNGPGGKVILWSDGITSAHGSASANGGAQGGNGGIVETSGRTLDLAGMHVTAGAARGAPGTWLLDPGDILIDEPSAASISDSLNNSTNVTVSTRDAGSGGPGDILVNASIEKTAGADTTLLLEASRDITVNRDVRIASLGSAGGLHVHFNADWDNSGGGAVALLPGSAVLSNGGNVRIYGQDDPLAGRAHGSDGMADGVLLQGATIDSRRGQSDAGASGLIAIAGTGADYNDFGFGSGFSTASAPSPDGVGVRIDNSSLLSTTGDITISGTGGTWSSNSPYPIQANGVVINLVSGPRIATGSGALTVVGIAGDAGMADTATAGLLANIGAGSGISTAGGAINFSGTGRHTGGAGIDVSMWGGSISGGGSVSMVGIGGVLLSMDSSALLGAGGALSLTGIGSPGANGVELWMNTASIRAAQIGISGDGGAGGAGVKGFLAGADIEAANGPVTIDGTGGAAGAGVDLNMSAASVGSAQGDVLISGTGGDARGSGVVMSSRDSESGADGSRGSGGIMTGSSARIHADRGHLTVAGINGTATPDDALPGRSVAGVDLTGIELHATGGDVFVAGAGVAGADNLPVGIAMTNVLASTSGGPATLAQGNVRILGVSSAATPALSIDGVTLGGAAMDGNIIIGGRNGGAGPVFSYPGASQWANAVQTTGVINLRPDDQNFNYGGVAATAIPISVGGTAGGFNISFTDLGIGRSVPANVVVGSAEHTGQMTFLDPTRFLGNLTLQNGGAGSEGIRLGSNLTASGMVTLSSGGAVSAPGTAIDSAGLLLHGSQPEASFVLESAGNSVGRLAAWFDRPASTVRPEYGDISFRNNGALVLAPLTGKGFSTIGNQASDIAAADTVAAGDLLVRASGQLTLAQGVGTLGGDITLVTDTFLDAGAHALTPAGTWRVFAGTWVGENRTGLPSLPHPNYYNCAYGDACGAAITGNRFIYRAQPTLTLTADNLARAYGAPNPALTFTQAGLVNGDTLADALDGAYTTAALRSSSVGAYPINGAFTSPVGYAIDARPGTLSIDRAALLISVDDKSKVYGDADPLLTATFAGLAPFDTASVVSGLTLNAPAGAAATAGSHPILGANAAAANYDITYRQGMLTVAKAPLLVVADNKSKVYGALEPVLTATMSGYRYGETATVVSGLTLSAPTGAAAGAGNHPIVAQGGVAANYTLDYLPGVLAVDPAVLTYVARPAVQLLGGPPAITGTVTGFAYDDTLASATNGSLQFASLAPQSAPAGLYAVEGRGLTAANYRFVQAPSNETALTILPLQANDRPTIAKDITFESSNVYEKNFGSPRLCVGTGPLGSGSTGSENNDLLALEWSRVRVSPNLSNCLGLGQRNSCQDF
jgi:filamentous hemagglutinin family protein